MGSSHVFDVLDRGVQDNSSACADKAKEGQEGRLQCLVICDGRLHVLLQRTRHSDSGGHGVERVDQRVGSCGQVLVEGERVVMEPVQQRTGTAWHNASTTVWSYCRRVEPGTVGATCATNNACLVGVLMHTSTPAHQHTRPREGGRSGYQSYRPVHLAVVMGRAETSSMHVD